VKVCVFGAGAVGTHLAVLLASTGVHVSVLARGANLAAVRAMGLALHTDEGVLHAQVPASDDPADLGPQDFVIVAPKAPALPAAAASIAALLGESGTAVFLQNGIPWWYHHGVGGARQGLQIPALDPGRHLWQQVGPHRLLGGITSTACTLLAPGVAQVKGGNRPMVLGEPDGSASPRLQALESLCKAAGFPVSATDRIRDAIWSKLALNLGSGPLVVLAPVALRDLYADAACVAARIRMMDETGAIARAMGCPIAIDHGLAFALNSPHIPSIAQDVLAGRKPEIEAMFHAPLQMARACRVATPTLDLLVALATMKMQAAGLYP
jgi:2-dehydropantoate 2-reductase